MMKLYPNTSLSLLTDLYELTMAQGYWKTGLHEDEAVFHLTFRTSPFQGGYAIACGLDLVMDFLKQFKFETSDLDFLSTLKNMGGTPLFEPAFLDFLSTLRISCDIDGVVEGEVVFPQEPLLRVQGPLLQAQLLETALLNMMNFSTLIATKASRISLAAQGEHLMEFGLRRAQGIDGGVTASRAAYVGGADSTSNVLAAKLFGIPAVGTMAHSWVMAFDEEEEAFQTYADAMPENGVFLVDTYDTLSGIKNAIRIGKKLKERGKKLYGIRLDSGDLTYLSIKARELLDREGFYDTGIIATNELNETLIADLKMQGAKINIWGVGTHLVTGFSGPALNGVYKLSALKKKGEKEWKYKIKLSDDLAKTSTPGTLQVRRYKSPSTGYVADALYLEGADLKEGCTIVDPMNFTRKRALPSHLESRDLLIPLFRQGKQVYFSPPLKDSKEYAKRELALFDKSIKRLIHPHVYPVGLEMSLHRFKVALIEKWRERVSA